MSYTDAQLDFIELYLKVLKNEWPDKEDRALILCEPVAFEDRDKLFANYNYQVDFSDWKITYPQDDYVFDFDIPVDAENFTVYFDRYLCGDYEIRSLTFPRWILEEDLKIQEHFCTDIQSYKHGTAKEVQEKNWIKRLKHGKLVIARQREALDRHEKLLDRMLNGETLEKLETLAALSYGI